MCTGKINFSLLWSVLFVTCAQAAPSLKIEQVEEMDFGKFSAEQSGRVEVDAKTGACRVSGGIVPMGGACTFAEFEVTGVPGARVRVDVPGLAELMREGGSADIRMHALRIEPDHRLTLGPNGKARFMVGGSIIPKNRNTPPGIYRGYFPVDVEYMDIP